MSAVPPIAGKCPEVPEEPRPDDFEYLEQFSKTWTVSPMPEPDSISKRWMDELVKKDAQRLMKEHQEFLILKYCRYTIQPYGTEGL